MRFFAKSALLSKATANFVLNEVLGVPKETEARALAENGKNVLQGTRIQGKNA